MPSSIETLAAEHPTPGQGSIAAGRRVLQLAERSRGSSNILCLLSGGGSSLIAAPSQGLTLQDLQGINNQLLRSGADISQINTVRKHVSKFKGGRLAAVASPSLVLSLSISDVAGDDPAVIASGPTVADPTTLADARRVLETLKISPSPTLRRVLLSADNETPKQLSNSVHYQVVATNSDALEAAERIAKQRGFTVVNLGQAQGEARVLAAKHAQLLRQWASDPSAQLALSGGETSVTVRGAGRGGRNSEYLLGLICALCDAPLRLKQRLHVLAADTDGIDGSERNAGAMLTPKMWERMRKLGLDPQSFLANNDAYSFFEQLDALLVTGATGTNVNDFRAIALGPEV